MSLPPPYTSTIFSAPKSPLIPKPSYGCSDCCSDFYNNNGYIYPKYVNHCIITSVMLMTFILQTVIGIQHSSNSSTIGCPVIVNDTDTDVMEYPTVGLIDINLWFIVGGPLGLLSLKTFLIRAIYVKDPNTTLLYTIRIITTILNPILCIFGFIWTCIGLTLYSYCAVKTNVGIVEAPIGSIMAYTAIMGLLYYIFAMITLGMLWGCKTSNIYCGDPDNVLCCHNA